MEADITLEALQLLCQQQKKQIADMAVKARNADRRQIVTQVHSTEVQQLLKHNICCCWDCLEAKEAVAKQADPTPLFEFIHNPGWMECWRLGTTTGL